MIFNEEFIGGMLVGIGIAVFLFGIGIFSDVHLSQNLADKICNELNNDTGYIALDPIFNGKYKYDNLPKNILICEKVGDIEKNILYKPMHETKQRGKEE